MATLKQKKHDKSPDKKKFVVEWKDHSRKRPVKEDIIGTNWNMNIMNYLGGKMWTVGTSELTFGSSKKEVPFLNQVAALSSSAKPESSTIK